MNFTSILASLLILIGVAGYFGTGMVSVTALIPAFFGLPLLILNLAAQKSKSPKPLLVSAAILSGLGFFGAIRGVIALMSGVLSTAVILQTLMFFICGIYTYVVIKQFKRSKLAAE